MGSRLGVVGVVGRVLVALGHVSTRALLLAVPGRRRRIVGLGRGLLRRPSGCYCGSRGFGCSGRRGGLVGLWSETSSHGKNTAIEIIVSRRSVRGSDVSAFYSKIFPEFPKKNM